MEKIKIISTSYKYNIWLHLLRAKAEAKSNKREGLGGMLFVTLKS